MPDDMALRLHTVIAAVCPNDGVAIGEPGDRATWRIDFRPDATAAQREAALTALAQFVIPAAAP